MPQRYTVERTTGNIYLEEIETVYVFTKSRDRDERTRVKSWLSNLPPPVPGVTTRDRLRLYVGPDSEWPCLVRPDQFDPRVDIGPDNRDMIRDLDWTVFVPGRIRESSDRKYGPFNLISDPTDGRVLVSYSRDFPWTH